VPVSSPASGMVDAGQSVTFTTVPTMGSGSYVSYTWSGLPAGCGGTTIAVTCDGSDVAEGSYDIAVTVMDSNGFSSAPSPSQVVQVDADPAVTNVSSTRLSVDLGQRVSFSATASMGSGAFTYAWTGLPTGCLSSSTALLTCAPTGPGTFSVQVAVTDSNNFTVPSPPLIFPVAADPQISLTASRPALDLGESTVITASGSSGSGGYGYGWSGLPPGCPDTGSMVSCTPAAIGNFSVQVRISDSNGGVGSSSVLVLGVAAPLSAVITATSTTPTSDQGVAFGANVSGGTGPITYAWEFGDGASPATGATVDHTFRSPGAYRVTLWVNDSTGASLQRTLNVTVSSPSGGVGTAPSTWEAIAGIGVAAIAALAGAVLVRNRRRTANGPSDAPGQESTDVTPPSRSSPEE
jgi:hypothetical protein